MYIFWLHWVFVAAHGLSLVVASGGYSLLWCTVFSLWWLLLLWSTGSRHTGFSSCNTWAQQLQCTGSRAHGLSSCGSQALEYRFSSCGTRTQLLHGLWGLPRPVIEPMYPALAGGFLTTAPPGKSPLIRYIDCKYLLPFSRQVFHFVDSFIHCAETFQFDVVPFVFSFVSLA